MKSLTRKVIDIVRDHIDIPNSKLDGIADDLDNLFADMIWSHLYEKHGVSPSSPSKEPA